MIEFFKAQNNKIEGKSEIKYGLYTVLAIIFVLICGSIITYRAGINRDSEMRNNLISRTKLVTASIDTEKLKKLKGNLSDLKNPDYKILKEKLMSIRSMENDIRFIYLVGLRNEEAFFFVDSEIDTSPDYSPPGQIYDEASILLKKIFINKKPFSEGILVDRWGVWVTGFAPIVESETGEVIAVCGMDIDGKNWNNFINLDRLGPVSVTIIITLLLTGFLFYQTISRKASLKIISSEKKYHALFNEMLSGLSLYRVITDDEGQPVDFQFLEVNPAFEKLTGLKKEDVTGKSRVDVMNTADWLDIFKDVYLTGKAAHFQKYYHKCSKYFDVIVYSPQPGHLAVNFNDITENKEAEKALRESEEKFRSISIAAQDGIIMMDNSGNISCWNSAAEKIFGYREEEILGKNLHYSLAKKGYHKAFNKAFELWQITGQGNAVGKLIELKALKKDGSEIEIELSLSSVKIKDSWHAIGIVRDITERKKIQKELKKAKEAAEAASIAKGQFLANMSHEIRTPMNGIIGMTDLLLDTDLTETQREFAMTIEKSADSLLSLINDILDFSKIESGKLDLEILEFDLREIVENIVDMLAVKAHEKNLEFAYLMYNNVPSLLQGDPGRLRQILLNLTGNAIKFTEKGEVLISIKLEEEDDPYVTIRFSVNDTGIGIPKERIDRLFKSFSQVDGSTTRKYGGTGLGLAISKYLSEAMGGKIGVESKEGRGSNFWFTARFKKQSGEKPPTIRIDDIKDTRILIVDDNETNRFVLREQLHAFGCYCEETSSGSNAIEKLERSYLAENPFKIAILDVQMPEMDGIILGKLIKENEKIKDTVLIMLSSLGNTDDAISMKETGCAAFLTKPVRQTQLYRAITIALGLRPVKNEFTSSPLISSVSDEIKQKIRILLAEDNITNQKVALRILEKMGYRANAVANGQEVLDAIENIPYDLILMDVQMPEMDGLTTTSIIREREKDLGKHIPVIAMTAHAMKGDRERCMEAGMDDYITKPVQPKELIKVIESFIDKEKKLSHDGHNKETYKEDKIYNRHAFLLRIDCDEEFENEILDMVLIDIPASIEEVEKSMERGDISDTAHFIHTIKGLAANVNAELVKTAAMNFETSCKKGNPDRELFEKLKGEFEKFKLFIDKKDFEE